jgi:hypothetical protein
MANTSDRFKAAFDNFCETQLISVVDCAAHGDQNVILFEDGTYRSFWRDEPGIEDGKGLIVGVPFLREEDDHEDFRRKSYANARASFKRNFIHACQNCDSEALLQADRGALLQADRN